MRIKNYKLHAALLACFLSLSALPVFAARESAPPEVNFEVETVEPAVFDEDEPTTDAAAEDSEEIDTVSLFASSLFDGEGTEESPYLLSTPEDLLNFAKRVNAGQREYTSCYYALTNDINLAGNGWEPIGYYDTTTSYNTSFHGVFDGAGYTVSNFKISIDDETSVDYVGFFGLIYNGSVKNLTVSDFTVQVKDATAYAGGVVGRFLSIGKGTTHVIENCHALNGTMDITSAIRVYAGGLAGYVHASEVAETLITDCSSNVDIDCIVNRMGADYVGPHIIRAGGLFGYSASNNADLIIKRCFSTGSVSADNRYYKSPKSEDYSSYVGGFSGYSGTNTNGNVYISDSYSTGSVIAKAIDEAYAGGFSAYTISSTSVVQFENCFSTGNVYALSSRHESYFGGFSSITACNADSAQIYLTNCYALGNVIDLGSNSSCGAYFSAYLQDEVYFENCFASGDRTVHADTLYDGDPCKLVTDAELANLIETAGLDTAVWQADADSVYPYPTLVNCPFSMDKRPTVSFVNAYGSTFARQTLRFGKTPSAPSAMPDSYYVFSHWSLYPGGPAVELDENPIYSDTFYHTNYTDEYVTFTIEFSADGEVFDSQELLYSTQIAFPNAPYKPDDKVFRYSFSHWSLTPDGDPVDTSSQYAVADVIYYAVYTAIPTGIWDGKTAVEFAGGDGTSEDPYLIDSGYQLYYLSTELADDSSLATAYYRLTKDIDLGGHEWQPIGSINIPFSGHFDGDGYAVCNFTLTGEQTYAGLFGYTRNASISRLEVTGFTYDIDVPQEEIHVGALVGYAAADVSHAVTEISECIASHGEIRVNGDLVYAGGLAGTVRADGSANAYIRDSYARADITVQAKQLAMIGGIAATFHTQSDGVSNIDACYFVGKLSADSDVAAYAGGIVGLLYDESGVIAPSDAAASLFAGAQSGNVRNSFASGNFAANTASGISSYAGHIYAYVNRSAGASDGGATIASCASDLETTVTATTVAAPSEDELTLVESASYFFDADNLAAMGFDTDTVWETYSDDFPTLKAFIGAKNVYRILGCSFSPANGTLRAEFQISFRDVEAYTVLAAAYDTRGKMIGFTATTIRTPEELQTVVVELNGIQLADTCKISVIDTATWKLLTETTTI